MRPCVIKPREVIEESGNVEAFELSEVTDKVQLALWQNSVTSGHVCCSRGRIISYDDAETRRREGSTALLQAAVRSPHHVGVRANSKVEDDSKNLETVQGKQRQGKRKNLSRVPKFLQGANKSCVAWQIDEKYRYIRDNLDEQRIDE